MPPVPTWQMKRGITVVWFYFCYELELRVFVNTSKVNGTLQREGNVGLIVPRTELNCCECLNLSLTKRTTLSLQSRPPFVSTPALVTALETLRELRNKLCQASTPKIEANDFGRFWADACYALVSFGAKSKDFDKVRKDGQRDWRFLLPETKGCANQERDILPLLETITKEQNHLLQGKKEIPVGRSELKQGQSTVLEVLSTIQPKQDSNHNRFVTIANYKIIVHDSAQVVAGDNARFTVTNPISSGRHLTREPERRLQLQECKTEVVMDKSKQAEDYSSKLKLSIKKQTGFLPRIRKEKKIGIDDIFTNMTIQRDMKHFDNPELAEGRYDKVNMNITLLNKCSEMFICPETHSCNPKSILLIGKAGIGKSLFCQKMVRDWAEGRLFDEDESPRFPDFQFAFLLKFRQLNVLGHMTLDLAGILNYSSTLDEDSRISEAVSKIIIEHPEQVLIILDGFDEYTLRDSIIGNSEKNYPKNDPKETIPVPAMIAKLLKGEILRGAVVVVTSRPGEANYMGEIIFDVKVEIKGFSSFQVMEYVRKYFKHDEVMKNNAVVDHIKGNETLVSFGHIPVMCYLMCYYMEWHSTKTKTTQNLPSTRADLYREVIKVFIKKHHAHLKAMDNPDDLLQGILERFAELAAKLIEQEKYCFSKEDLRKLNFSKEDIASLVASGLLDCGYFIVSEDLFSEVELEYTFTHLTVQEYLTAYWFVMEEKIPERGKHSEMTLIFFIELLSRKKDNKMAMVSKLLKSIEPKDEHDDSMRLLTLQCLRGFGDKKLATQKIEKLFEKFCNENGWVVFSSVTDMDCPSIAWFFYIVDSLVEESRSSVKIFKKSFIVNTLVIFNSMLTLSGVRVICNSLVNSTVTELRLENCNLGDSHCVQMITDLFKSKVRNLNLQYNQITGVDLQGIVKALEHKNCPVKKLNLWGNKLSEERKKSMRNRVKRRKPELELILEQSDLHGE